jgi:predicted kinase
MFRAALSRCANLLDARAAAGKVRRCHGDLHLRNICLLDGAPTLFDCIEFDDEIATIDVLYDLAFLVMDLWHRSQHSDANLVFNRYLDAADETDGIPLLPFFMAIRSAIRAHVAATQSEDAGPAEGGQLVRQAKSYFELSKALLAAAPARLVAIGGLSGTGKSSLASSIASRIGPPPGARVLSSDRIRKALYGVPAEERLPACAYRPEISERVYATQAEAAAATLGTGHAVIADAVFDRVADRKRIEQCAVDAGVPFSGIWLEAQTDILLKRVGARRGDPSDATEDIVRMQAAKLQAPIEWSRVSAADDLAGISSQVLEALNHGRQAG